MSGDIGSLVMDLFNVVDFAIFAFGAFRAFQIGRALVTPAYKKRAFWTGALMLTFILTSVLDDYVPFFSTTQSTVLKAVLSEVPSVAETLILFTFIDSTLLAAIETDFFHRNSLWWKSVRLPAFAAMSVSLVAAETVAGYAPTSSSWLSVGGFGIVLGLLGFSVVALAVSARRTPDKTMRRFVRLLAYALTSFVVGITWLLLTPDTLGYDLVSDILLLLASYILYRAVMTLSPLGRVEEDADAGASPPPAMER